MLWSGECKLQEQNNTTETPIGEEQEEKRFFKNPVHLKSYKHLGKYERKNMRCKINITLLKNYMKETFWQASTYRQSKRTTAVEFALKLDRKKKNVCNKTACCNFPGDLLCKKASTVKEKAQPIVKRIIEILIDLTNWSPLILLSSVTLFSECML